MGERGNSMWTRWGREVWEKAQGAGEIPLPEYPRPSLERRTYWENLNGFWDYAIQKDPGKGREEMPSSFDGRILVPFSPEAPLSGVGRTLLPGEVLHYRRTWTLSEKKSGGHYLLHFGAVDQSCRVYVNGSLAGEHVGGYLPFTLDITALVREGENALWLAVRDESDTGYHARGKQKLQRGGMWYTAQSGIWQTVWAEWVPEVYLRSLRVEPLPDLSGVRICVEAEGKREEQKETREGEEREEQKAEAEISLQGKKIASLSLAPGEEGICPLPGGKLWSPEDPVLYDLTLTLGEDQVFSYFGLRSVTRERDEQGIWRVFLNGKPRFLSGVLDQGYFPDGLYTAPSEEAMTQDIRVMKSLGFTFLRKHIKIEPERFYYACDRLGMLLWQDMVNGGTSYNDTFVTTLPNVFPPLGRLVKDSHYKLFSREEEASRQEYTRELVQTVEHLRNHPSIMTWVPFNEGWGQFDAGEAVRRIREMDPTRLVDEASGWFDQGGGDYYSIHNYFLPLRVSPKKDRIVALTECGGYSLLIPGHAMVEEVYGYRKYAAREELEEALTKLWKGSLLPAVRRGLCVTLYTQVSDIEDEVNGFLTYDRKVLKVGEELMRSLNACLEEAFSEIAE